MTKDFSRLIECIKARDSKLNNFLNSTFPTISQITRDEKLTSLFRDKKHARPDLVFKIEWSEGKEKRFDECCGATSGEDSRISKLAFHGSKPENFYSILQHGLVNCLNKRGLFGSGTYLSTEIDVALSFAPAQVVNIKEWLSKSVGAWNLVGPTGTARSADTRSEGFTSSPNYQFEVNLSLKMA